MKKLFIILSLFLCLHAVSYAQIFYVEKTDGEYEQPILDKLIELKKEITTEQKNSKYTIQCVISKKPAYGKPGEGYVIILETKSGTMVAKSESEKGMVSMFKGFKNPKWVIMEKVADKHLEKAMQQLNTNSSITEIETPNIKSTPKTKEEKLVELKQLYEKQLITKEEYEAEKKKILAEQ